MTDSDLIRACVIGFPVKHSLSPHVHGYWLKEYGINGEYNLEEISPEDLEETFRELADMGYAGCNVTVPHKETVLDLVDVADEAAQRIGAVNTVIFRDGKSVGTNTDAYGFMRNLKQQVPDLDLKSGPVVILGAGGAARAICVGLLDAGADHIILTNRTQTNARALKRHLGADNIEIFDWERRGRSLAGASLVINASTLGMEGKHKLKLPLDKLPEEAVVCDIVYVPLKTQLLEDAEKRGNRIVDGIGMLLWQAQPGFELWYGKRPEVTSELRDYVLKKIR